jgi:hypothetical protein
MGLVNRSGGGLSGSDAIDKIARVVGRFIEMNLIGA